MKEKKYDVALSYASEQVQLVKRVYKILTSEGLKVFFAPAYPHELYGEDRIKTFYNIFRHESLFVAAFVSENYVKKDITTHEAKSAIARNNEEKVECLVPFYLDNTKLPNLDEDILYSKSDDPIVIASILKQKVMESKRKSQKKNMKEKKSNTDYSQKITIGIVHGDINNYG